ncbi:hypothetical protein TNCV_947031 [Trichonephila clavipes]|nr:hypothetical protein TNCV_947031 [Trichonephila clavipes]
MFVISELTTSKGAGECSSFIYVEITSLPETWRKTSLNKIKAHIGESGSSCDEESSGHEHWIRLRCTLVILPQGGF